MFKTHFFFKNCIIINNIEKKFMYYKHLCIHEFKIEYLCVIILKKMIAYL